MTRKIRLEMGCSESDFKVIATGGMAHLIAPYAQSIEEVDPLLTLKGLRLLHSQATDR
jgi:type III pantothenate kinase